MTSPAQAESPPDRVAVITDHGFWRPTKGSEQRIATLLDYLLQQGFPLSVLRTRPLPRSADARTLHSWRERVVLHAPTRGLRWWWSLRGPRRHRLSPVPALQRESSAAGAAWVRHYLQREPPAAVIVEFLKLAYTLTGVPTAAEGGPRRILDTHDPVHLRAQRYEAAGQRVPLALSREEEARVLADFDALLAIQEEDARLFHALAPATTVLTVPHGLPVPQHDPQPRSSGDGSLRAGFLGAGDVANETAVRWWAEQVDPALDGRVTLVVAGAVCDRLTDLASLPGIELRGRVPTPSSLWQEVDLAVNPVFFGTGLKIKNVEALSAGLPLVTTEVGLEGMREAEGAGAVRADTPGEWSTALLALAAQPAERLARGRQGREWARTRFSPEAAFAPLLQFLRSPPPNRTT